MVRWSRSLGNASRQPIEGGGALNLRPVATADARQRLHGIPPPALSITHIVDLI
jgi:hypothetical protein